MAKNILLLLFVSFCLSAAAQTPKWKLVTTQISKGKYPGNDYIQLLVDGKNTCSEVTGGDSIANLSRVAIYDSNLDSIYITRGTDTTWGLGSGKYRFPAKAPWDSISFGTQILVYNDKNTNSEVGNILGYSFPNLYIVKLSQLELIDSANVDTASIQSVDSILPSPKALGFSNQQGVMAILKNPIYPPNFTTSASDWLSSSSLGNELPAGNKNEIDTWIPTLLVPATHNFSFYITADPGMRILTIGTDPITGKTIYDTIKECAPKQVLLTKSGLTLSPSDVSFTWLVNGVADTIFTLNGSGLTDTSYYGGDTLTVSMYQNTNVLLKGTTTLKCITGKKKDSYYAYTRPSVKDIPSPLKATIFTDDTLSKPLYNRYYKDTAGIIDSTLIYMGFCYGSRAKFHAHPDSTTSSDVYEWIRNGVVVSYDTTYIDSNIIKGIDTLLFHIRSNVPCLVKNDFYDTILVRGLDSLPIPKVFITGDSGICSNVIDTFRAVFSPNAIGDSSAVYNLAWYVGGVLTFSDTTNYKDGDIRPKEFIFSDFTNVQGDSSVYAVLLAKKTLSCPYYDSVMTNPPDSLTDTSNSIHLQITPFVTPTVANIIATQDGLCARPFVDSIQFTATTDSINNGAGSNPKFLWYVNGVQVQNGTVSLYEGTDARLGRDTIINNGDTSILTTYGGLYYDYDSIGVRVINTTAKCFAVSDTSDFKYLVLKTFDPYPPTVSLNINTSQSFPLCQLDNVASIPFTSSGVNLGVKPKYTWYVNNIPVNDSTSSYLYDRVNANDSVKLEVYSSVACARNRDTFAIQSITITPPFTAAVYIDTTTNNSNPTSVCLNDFFKLFLFETDGQTLENNSTTFDIYINNNLYQQGLQLPLNISASSLSSGTNSVFVVTHSGVNCTANKNDTSNVITIIGKTVPNVNPISGSLVSDGANAVCVGSFKGVSESTIGGTWSVTPATALKIDTFGVINGVDTAKVTGIDNNSSPATLTYTVKDATNGCSTSVSTTVSINLNSFPQDVMVYKTRCTFDPLNIDTIYNSGSVGNWYTSNSSIATVQDYVFTDINGNQQHAGIVTAVSNGKVYIYDSIFAPDCGSTVRIDTLLVGPPVIDSITGDKVVCLYPNGSTQLTAHVSGDTAHLWSSDNLNVATVDTNGLVTTVGQGDANITFTAYNVCTGGFSSASSSYQIHVGAPTYAGNISGTSNLCVGSSTTSNPFTSNVSGGIWSIKDPIYAQIDSVSGVATGKVVGSDSILYSVSNKCGSFYTSWPVTISTEPAKYPITSSDSIVCTSFGNNTLQLSNAQTTGGSWESLNTDLATVDPNSGLVTGLSNGLATIRYTVTQSCGSYNTDTIIVVGAPVKGSYLYNSPICSKDTVKISNTIRGAKSYSWSVIKQDGNNLKTIEGNQPTGVFTGVDGGNATILFVAFNRCGSSLKDLSDSSNYVNIKVNGLPAITTIAGKSEVCLKDTTTLVAGSVLNGVWSSDSANVATVSQSGFLTAVGTGSTSISYKVFDASTGCHDSVTTIFKVDSIPVVPAIVGANNLFCTNRNILLTDAKPNGVWFSSDNSIAKVDLTGIVTGVKSGSVNIVYKFTDSHGCKDSSIAPINVFTTPIVTPIVARKSELCAKEVITYTNNTAKGVWFSTDASVANVNSDGAVTGLKAGVDTIIYKVTTTDGCADSAKLIITIDSIPTVNPIVGADVPFCYGRTVSLTDSLIDNNYFAKWKSQNTTIATVNQDGKVSCIQPGSTNIDYTVTNGKNCSNTATVSITVNAIPAIGPIEGVDKICVGVTTSLTNKLVGGVWKSSSPLIDAIDSVSGKLTALAATKDETVTISYKVVTNGCDTSVSKAILTQPKPSIQPISFTKDSVNTGLTIKLNDAIKSGTWSSLNENIASVDIDSGVVKGVYPGKAQIVYTVKSSALCEAYDTLLITVLTPLVDVYVPNFFSPSSTNDSDKVFKVFGQSISAIDFRVYSPWGTMVYHTTDIHSTGWDGKYNGTDMPTGVYVYTARITVKDLDNKQSVITKKGAVNLVR